MAGTPALSRFPWWRRWFGDRSERAAADFLTSRGYRILVRNFRCSHGELDVIAHHGGCTVFVEVRSTGGADPARPALSVDHEKQRRLTDVALFFLQQNRLLGTPARFDVITVHWPAETGSPVVTHFPNSFEAVGHHQLFS